MLLGMSKIVSPCYFIATRRPGATCGLGRMVLLMKRRNLIRSKRPYEAWKSTSPHFKFAKLIIKLIKKDKREENVQEE